MTRYLFHFFETKKLDLLANAHIAFSIVIIFTLLLAPTRPEYFFLLFLLFKHFFLHDFFPITFFLQKNPSPVVFRPSGNTTSTSLGREGSPRRHR